MSITFEPLAYAGWAVVAAAVAVTAAAVASWRNAGVVGKGRAVALLGLRLGAVTSVVLFILSPNAVYETVKSAAAPVAILVDSSASMDLEAGERTRLAVAIEAAEEVARAIAGSGGDYDVYDFSARRRPWGDVVPAEEAVREGGSVRTRTDAAKALRELAARYGREGLAAAVVLSDGVWEAAPSAEGLPPCYTMSPAAGPPPGRVFITDVDVPGVVLPETNFDVRVRYYATVKAGAEVTAHLGEVGGGEAEYPWEVTPGRGEVVAAAAVRDPGDHFFRLRVGPEGGERWFHVRVLERPRRVWYWEMAGDADFAFLRRALASHASFEVGYRLELNEGVIGSAPSMPERTEVVILGNPRAGEMTPAEAGALERHAASGGGLLIVVSARPADAEALTAGPLARLLPVRVRANVAASAGGKLEATSYPGSPEVYAEPPVVTHGWRLGPPKESATPVWRSADGTPALVTMPYGLGRVALFSAGGVFKRHLASGGDGLSRLAAALVLALYDEQSEGLAVSRRVVEPGEVVEITCRSPAEPTVVYAAPGGAAKSVALVEIGEGLWVGEFEVGGGGRYEVTARIPTAAGIDVRKAALLAREATTEYRAFNPRPDRLAALAAATGGRHFEPGDVEGLATAIAARVKAAPEVSATDRRDLWPPWLAFPAALAFLVVDWIWRRRIGLR